MRKRALVDVVDDCAKKKKEMKKNILRTEDRHDDQLGIGRVQRNIWIFWSEEGNIVFLSLLVSQSATHGGGGVDVDSAVLERHDRPRRLRRSQVPLGCQVEILNSFTN